MSKQYFYKLATGAEMVADLVADLPLNDVYANGEENMTDSQKIMNWRANEAEALLKQAAAIFRQLSIQNNEPTEG